MSCTPSLPGWALSPTAAASICARRPCLHLAQWVWCVKCCLCFLSGLWLLWLVPIGVQCCTLLVATVWSSLGGFFYAWLVLLLHLPDWRLAVSLLYSVVWFLFGLLLVPQAAAWLGPGRAYIEITRIG